MLLKYKRPLLGGAITAGALGLFAVAPSNPVAQLSVIALGCLGLGAVLKSGVGDDVAGLIPAEKEPVTPPVIEALESLGLRNCELIKTHHGKVLMRHIIKVPRGKLPALNNTDLARNLGVQSVTINPNAGNGCIAIELPAPKRVTIDFEVVIKSKAWIEAAKGKALPILLGEDADGNLLVIDLATQPHMLIAGETNSGKSVMVNAALLSLLSTNPLLELILIDPKQVELTPYNASRFCHEPAITDMSLAAEKLADVVEIMERRYGLMADAGVKNIAGYNNKSAEKLPYIVIVIDEFADLILMSKGKKRDEDAIDVESLVVRLCQKARAAGIHLMIATQRPSADVVTGLVKANVPTKIALKVTNRINSSIVLDQDGAENLLGYGDGLAKIKDGATPLRFHGAFCDDDDVKKWVI